MRIGLLIDGENIAARHLPAALRHAHCLGAVTIPQVFADFSQPASQPWQQACTAHGLRARHQPSLGKGKNSTDIAIAVEAMALVGDGRVDGICLVSSDRDFVPLALHLRERGIPVHACGLALADQSWRSACASYHDLSRIELASPAPEALLPKQSRDAIVRIIGDACVDQAGADKGGWLPLSAAAAALRAKAPHVADELCIKGKFRKLLRATALFEEAARDGAICIRPRGA